MLQVGGAMGSGGVANGSKCVEIAAKGTVIVALVTWGQQWTVSSVLYRCNNEGVVDVKGGDAVRILPWPMC